MQIKQDTAAIIVCAGSASRMQGMNKILLPLGETNVAGTSMLAFEQCSRIAEIIVVARPCDHAALLETAELCGITKLKTIVAGGDTRQASVMQGVQCVSSDIAMIAIHDGARPLVRPEQIEDVIKDAAVFGGATLGVPVKDTIKIVSDGLITDTPYRPSLYITQTPQVFKKALYLKAAQFAVDHALDFTDDCQLAEAIGCKVCMTTGDYTNIKITTPEDIEIAQLLLRRTEKKEDALC